MAIDYDGAQKYFAAKHHHKAAVWSGFNVNTRTGALMSARRILSRGLSRPLNEDEKPYTEGDRIREEYAVYEQALWMLESGQIADATGNDPVAVLTGRPDAADNSDRVGAAALFAPEALRWLGGASGAVIRG